MEFPCTKCGCCCRKIERLKAYLSDDILDPFYFPYKIEGGCEMLRDNLCSVYEKRPLLCNIMKLIKFHLDKADFCGHKTLTEKEYVNLQIGYCNAMMNEEGTPMEFRIKSL